MIKSLSCLVLFILAGCSSHHSIESNAGNWRVSFSPPPDEIPLNELFEVHTRIYGNGEINSLQVDAGMPSHGHGMMTKAVTTLQDDGSYLTTGMLLHMPGEWEVYFDIDNGKVIERAQETLILEP